MNKKGFTLIELLAVIVILAIIALIAVPIVLNIIDETKNNAGLRSAEMYVKAAELSIAQSTLKNKNITDGVYNIKNGNICLNTDCSDKLEVEVNGKVPESGTITVVGGSISTIELNYKDENTIVKNSDGDLVYQTGEKVKTIDDICTQDTTNGIAPKTAGAKYSCEVKEGTSYNFYVLTTPESGSKTINLIMDQNIYSDGTPAGMIGVTQSENVNKYSLVAWYENYDNRFGPIAAMQFLYNATKDWTNIDPITYEYKDKDYQGTTASGYTSFVAEEGVLTIIALSGTTTTIGTSDVPLRARMPIYSGVKGSAWNEKTSEKGEVADKTENNTYLYDNLNPDGNNVTYGYWTLSSYADNYNHAWIVSFNDNVNYNDMGVGSNDTGVRPVINLKI